VDGPGRGADRAGRAVDDVLADGLVEEDVVLGDDRHRAAQVVHVVLLDRAAVDENLAGVV
jgi:hypothetical protein